MFNHNAFYIPVRIASTGSNLAAVIAGKIPEINPIKAANPVPKTYLFHSNPCVLPYRLP